MASFERYESAIPRARDAEIVAAFLRGVYGWMCGGLAITAATAWLVAGSPAIVKAIITNQFLFWGLALAHYLVFITLFLFLLRFMGNRSSARRVGY